MYSILFIEVDIEANIIIMADDFHFPEFDENVDEELTGESCTNFDLPDFYYKNENMDSSSQHKRCIVHIDIDCFYAQVEMNENPAYRNKPMGVQQKNLVVTTNYTARKAGVPKSCWVKEALNICPNLILVNGEDLYKYRKVSRSIFEFLLKTYQCPVERLGMDENFLDVTNIVKKRISSNHELCNSVQDSQDLLQTSIRYLGNVSDCKNPVLVQGHCYSHTEEIICNCGCDVMLKEGSILAKEIRDRLYYEFSITSSGGIAHNKTLAKMVGNRHKPNDQTTIFPCDVNTFMLEHDDVKAIPGIGSSLSKLLKERKGIKSVADLREATMVELANFLDNVTAKKLLELCYGIDNSAVKTSSPQKSIGLEDRFREISTKDECVEKLDWLIGRICVLLHEDGRLPRVLKVTVRDYLKDKFVKKFHKESRQCRINPNLFKSLAKSSDLDPKCGKDVASIAISLLQKMVNTESKFHLTLIGLSVGDFVSVDNRQSISTYFYSKSAVADDKATATCTFASTAKSTLLKSNLQPSEHLKKVPSNSIRSFFSKTSGKSTSACRKNKRHLQDNGQSAKKLKISNEQYLMKDLPQSGNNQVNSEDLNTHDVETRDNKKLSSGDNLLNRLPKGWDPHVFLELPDDIREELLRQHNTKSPVTKHNFSKNSNIESYFLK